MKTLVVERTAILNNLAVVKERIGKGQIIAALSGDGMGVGVSKLAKILVQGGVRDFAVENPEEAKALRKAGLTEEHILLLRSITEETQLRELLDLGVTCSIGSHEAGMALNSFAKEQGTVVEAHIQVDTGTGFGGFWGGDPEQIITMYKYLPNVAVTGIYTTLHSNARGQNGPMEQLGVLGEVIEQLEKAGHSPGLVHAAGSYALMNLDFSHMDAVRAGSVLMGRCRRTREDGLTVVGYGECEVAELRWLNPGQSIGTREVVTVKKAVQVAVIPVGYVHGFGVRRPQKQSLLQRLFPKRETVEIDGRVLKVLGEIGSYDTLVEVTGMDIKPGATVKFAVNPLYANGLQLEFR